MKMETGARFAGEHMYLSHVSRAYRLVNESS